MPRSTPGFAHLAVISLVVSVFCLCLPSVCSASYIQHLTHWPVPNIFQKYTHILWFKFKPWFEQNRCFCIKTVFSTKSCFTQKPCYTQTQCFTQKPCSCWACARAVCGLQDSRNPWWPTPSREDHHACIQFRCCRDTLGTIPPRRHSRPCQSKGRPGFNTQKINREGRKIREPLR